MGPPGSRKSGTPQRIRHSICRRRDREREKLDGRERNTGKREEVLSVLTVSILAWLTQEEWLDCSGLGLGGDDSKFQRSFPSVPLKR